jgi:hypothetical protein
MALSTLEILHRELRSPQAASALTLEDLARNAAATVAFGRDTAGDTLASLIRQVLSAPEGTALTRTRTEIETGAASYTSLKPEVISGFTSQVLMRARIALEQEGEKVFLEELLGEAADAIGLDEHAGSSLFRNLISIAARQLRPRPPLHLTGLPEGVYVLAVNLRSTGEVKFQGYEFRGSRWSPQTLGWGTDYVVEALGKSMALRHRFRRIVPCRNIGDVSSLVADYLLVVDISDQNWREIVDPRKTAAKPEEMFSLPLVRERAAPGRKEDRTMELALTLDWSIEVLPAGNRIWTRKHTVTRYRDELASQAAVRSRDSVFDGILDLVASQTRVELAKLK